MFSKIKTYFRLGIANALVVVWYRLCLKFGYFAKKQPINHLFSKDKHKDFFSNSKTRSDIELPTLKAFGWIDVDTSIAPNWLQAINSTKTVDNNTAHWSLLNDFSLNIGDIKTVWELSRFDWTVYFSVAAVKSGDNNTIQSLNDWLHDWCQHNPINQGVNWKCGQEASIRVMHLICSCLILQQGLCISGPLGQLIFAHLERIAPTRFYAMAQDNNHGTSEACALFVGATILLAQENQTFDQKLLHKWQKQGRYWLGNRVNKLIDKDGLFSQYSVNYHRLMLDTLSFAEQVRLQFQQPEFSTQFYIKAKLASQWLYQVTQPCTGDAPNIGANDGARLFPITQSDYRDYRPSVQWAFGLFCQQFAYPVQGPYQQLTTLLSPQNKTLLVLDETYWQGFNTLSTQVQKLSSKNAVVYMKTPQAKFRPSSCDALHIDLWVNDLNLLRDAGSYSYNCEPELEHYFKSTGAHNTVEFDQHEQMPKLSRFLYGDWTTSDIIETQENLLSVTCQYHHGASHHRHLLLTENQLTVTDKLSNFQRMAVIRFRLPPAAWTLKNSSLTSELANFEFEGLPASAQIKLVDGLESRYYLQKSVIPVVEITIKEPATITTIINWAS